MRYKVNCYQLACTEEYNTLQEAEERELELGNIYPWTEIEQVIEVTKEVFDEELIFLPKNCGKSLPLTPLPFKTLLDD